MSTIHHISSTLSNSSIGDLATAASQDSQDQRVETIANQRITSVPQIETEFNASNAIVALSLTNEAFGVGRNGISLATGFTPGVSVGGTAAAAKGLSYAFAPLAILQGLFMAIVGGKLLPGCFTRVQEAQKGSGTEEKVLSVANLVDKIFLTAIGLSLISIGVIAILASQGIVPGSAYHIASLVFCIIVTVRGLEMTARGGYTLYQIQQFQNEFLEKIKTQSPDQIFKWLKQEQQKDRLALKNRIGDEALKTLEEILENPQKQNETSSMYNLLKQIDKGIAEEKLKQQLVTSIGSLMLLGGSLGIPCELSGLVTEIAAPAVIALNTISGGTSLSMETLWMPYDKPSWFKKLFNWRYEKHEKEHPIVRPLPAPIPMAEPTQISDPDPEKLPEANVLTTIPGVSSIQSGSNYLRTALAFRTYLRTAIKVVAIASLIMTAVIKDSLLGE